MICLKPPIGLRERQRHAGRVAFRSSATLQPLIRCDARLFGDLDDLHLILDRHHRRRRRQRRLVLVERRPRLLPDDAVNIEAARVLIILHRALGDGAEVAVDLPREIGQHSLQVFDILTFVALLQHWSIRNRDALRAIRPCRAHRFLRRLVGFADYLLAQ